MGIKNGFLEDFRKAVWNTSPVAKFINDNPLIQKKLKA